MIPILLLLTIAGLLLLLLKLISRRSSPSRPGPAWRRRLASAGDTAEDSDIAPVGLFASGAGDDDPAGYSGESVNPHYTGGRRTEVEGGDVGCRSAAGDVTGGDMGSTDMGSTDAGGGCSD